MSAPQRLNKVLRELNISMERAVNHLKSKGIEIQASPNTKIDEEEYNILVAAFQTDMTKKLKSEEVSQKQKQEKEAMRAEIEAKHEKTDAARQKDLVIKGRVKLAGIKEVGKIDLNPVAPSKPALEVVPEKAAEPITLEKKIQEVEAPVAEVIQEVDVIAVKTSEIEAEKPETWKKEEEVKTETNVPEPIVQEVEVKNEEKQEELKAVETVEQPPVKEVALEVKVPQEPVSTFEKAPMPEQEVKELETPEAKTEMPEEILAQPVQEIKLEAPVAESQVTQTPAAETPVVETPAAEGVQSDRIETKYEKLTGPVFTGAKIDLSKFERPKKKVASSTGDTKDKKPQQAGTPNAASNNQEKKKRKRIAQPGTTTGQQKPNTPGNQNANNKKGPNKPQAPAPKQELTDEQIQKQIKETLEKLTGGGKKSKGSKLRRAKREERREMEAKNEANRIEEGRVLKVTEFVTVNELATMMSVASTEIISACMSLGIMVTMNQRLDAETLTIVAEEFGFQTSFVDADVQEAFEQEVDKDEDLKPRAPIVTVMGHVDHGKTSLLDYIRKTNVIAGESGGITQHIGAYSVQIANGQHISFLDTPGHEAFTAMRARGAQVTDVVIVVVAADDDVMPQTKEAIAHAQAANVPFVIAINKVDKPTANAEKIREKLSMINVLVEDWGGKIQCQEVSAKSGLGIEELLDKVLLEAEVLELSANPNRMAIGTIIEASLDKGRGYMSTILVQNGTLKVGDYVLAGPYSGKVRALLDERGNKIKEAGPAMPASMLGLDGAPQAGDRFVVMADEREAKQIATRRQQLQREQSVRTSKSLTLEEIGRRLALGDFKELNIVLKGDVDGSIEALSDSLEKLTTEQIQVRIIHKAVGQISESDVLLAAASGAIVVGFQVRPSSNARKLAEKEEVDIRLYSIIYDAINEVRDAMEGMLAPEIKEEITCNVEVRDVFKISKVGTVAGCMVLDGTVTRNTRVRLVRNGVVVYTGELGSLKRFKDDVKEVSRGFECGLNIHNFNDIKVGDIIEGFKEVQVKKTL